MCEHPDASVDHAERFADPGDRIYDFMAEGILVECPQCGGCAEHRPVPSEIDERDWFAPRRLVCPICGLVQHWQNKSLARRWYETPARDDYSGQLLWLRGEFGKHEVWAYNWNHLDLIDRYVAALHRTRTRDADTGWSNRSFVNRLPKWMTSAKNRLKVLELIAKIRNAKSS